MFQTFWGEKNSFGTKAQSVWKLEKMPSSFKKTSKLRDSKRNIIQSKWVSMVFYCKVFHLALLFLCSCFLPGVVNRTLGANLLLFSHMPSSTDIKRKEGGKFGTGFLCEAAFGSWPSSGNKRYFKGSIYVWESSF